MKNFKIKTTTLISIISLTLLAVFLIVFFISNRLNQNNNSSARNSPTPINTDHQSTEATPTIIPTPTLWPASEQTSSLPPTPTPTPTPIVATVISAGDCVIHDALLNDAKIDDEDIYDFTHMFKAIKPFVEKSNYALISFEGAATNNRNDYAGYPFFNCAPEIFDAFKYAGFNLVNNSNNHQLDRRVNGMLETRENIKNAGLDIIGAYDGEETRYIIKDVNGIKIGFMAYTYGSNGNEALLTSDQIARHLAFFDKPRMEKEIRELEEKADITIVSMHWGHEYWKKPNQQQIDLSNDLFSWGADVILGSHPHVIQPSEIREIDGEIKYINYAMGNFLTNQWHEPFDNPEKEKWYREDGMLVNLEFTKAPDTEKTIISKITHIPTWVSREEVDGEILHQILPIPSRDYYKTGDLNEELLKKAIDSYDRTIGYFTDYELKD